MTRDAYTDRLLDLAYGELSRREAREVEAHAASCEACGAELGRIRGTRRIMAALPDEPAPDRGERILIAAAREAAEARRPRRLVPRWLLGGAVAAASLAVVAVVSYRVIEIAPRRDDRTALLGESPYATPPPAPEPQASAPPPAQAEGGAADRDAARPAPEAKGIVAEPPRIAAAPRPSRREAPPSAPPARDGLQAYASPPPPAPAPAPSARLEAESRGRVAAAERPADEAPKASAEAAAPPAMAAAPSASAAQPPRAAAGAAPERASPGAMRKSAAAPEARAGYGAADTSAAAPLHAEVRRFPGCEGEALRRVEVDARGRTVRYVREGRVGGRRLRIDHAFDPDGRPAGVTVTDLDAPGVAVDARALGLSLPASAGEAGIDAPPRCGR